MPEISAIVLAGGKSQRLGIDKSLLRLTGAWLLEQILHALATLSDDLIVVANPRPEFSQLAAPQGGTQAAPQSGTQAARIVPDIWPGIGPLGGIYSGLRAMRHERGLFVACDMPFLNLPLLRYMILLSPDFDVVIPSIADKTEPLHAIYSQACIGPIEELLQCSGHSAMQGNELRVVHFFPKVRVRYVTQNEIDVFDPAHLSFFNINRAEDLEIAQRLTKSKAHPQ